MILIYLANRSGAFGGRNERTSLASHVNWYVCVCVCVYVYKSMRVRMDV
jgi:hypothetical protein